MMLRLKILVAKEEQTLQSDSDIYK